MFLRPVITEKSTKSIESFNEYTFVAPRRSTKSQVKKIVEELFKVKVIAVKTKVSRGKEKKVGKKGQKIKKADTKKVIVVLDKKDKIGLFDLKETKK